MSRERIQWIDMLKGITMILVVIGHMDFANDGIVKTYLYSFHMPLFFMISGMTYALGKGPSQISFRDFALKKTGQLLLPYFAWNFVALPYWYLNIRILKGSQQPVSEAIKGIFFCNQNVYSGPTNATWFLVCLYLTELAFFLVEKWSGGDRRILDLAMVLCSVIGFQAGTSKFFAPWQFTTVPAALFFFWGGVRFQRGYDRYAALAARTRDSVIFWAEYIGIILLFGYAGCRLAMENGRTSMVGTTYGNYFYYFAAAILTSAALILIVIRLPVSRVITFIGRNSLTYVALQCMILRTLENLNDFTSQFAYGHPWLCALFITLLLLPVSLVTGKIPILNGKLPQRKED